MSRLRWQIFGRREKIRSHWAAYRNLSRRSREVCVFRSLCQPHRPKGLRQEFAHFGLTTKYQLTTALARLRERGDPACGMGEGVADLARREQPLTPGFALPSPLGEGFYQVRAGCKSKCGNSSRRPRGLRQPNLSHLPWRSITLLVTIHVWAQPAYAHVQKGEAIGFLSGLHHPISGLDHVLAMIAVGLWGAQLGAPAVWLLPVCFPMVMAMGGMLGLMGVHVPGIEIGIAASAILLGAAVMSEARPPLMVAAALVAFFAVFHGYAHGTELPAGESGLLYSMGFVIATGCLHGVGITIGTIHRWRWGQRLLRLAGAGVALAGVFFMWRAVA